MAAATSHREHARCTQQIKKVVRLCGPQHKIIIIKYIVIIDVWNIDSAIRISIQCCLCVLYRFFIFEQTNAWLNNLDFVKWWLAFCGCLYYKLLIRVFLWDVSLYIYIYIYIWTQFKVYIWDFSKNINWELKNKQSCRVRKRKV